MEDVYDFDGIKNKHATAFKKCSAKHGKTANTVLKEYVIECIENNKEDHLNNSDEA